MAREQQLAVELEQRELQAREDKEAWEAQAEAKRKLVQLQRWLPKGMIKMSAVAPELDLEIQRIRTQRLQTFLPAHLELALTVRTAHAALAMSLAEREVSRDRVDNAAAGCGTAMSVAMGGVMSGGI